MAEGVVHSPLLLRNKKVVGRNLVKPKAKNKNLNDATDLQVESSEPLEQLVSFITPEDEKEDQVEEVNDLEDIIEQMNNASISGSPKKV